MKNQIEIKLFVIMFFVLVLSLVVTGVGNDFCKRQDDINRILIKDVEMIGYAVCDGASRVKRENASGECVLAKLAFRETIPESYFQICQTDYTRFVYEEGYYYFQSAADHLYLYRVDEQGENRECLAEQIPKELYVVGDWVYFTNLSAGRTLYRAKVEGRKLEEVFSQQINRFVPLGDVLYCLTEEGSLYSWQEDQGAELLCSGDIWWLNTDGTFLYLWIRELGESYTVVVDTEGNLIAKYDAFPSKTIPDKGNLYSIEYVNKEYFLTCSSIKNGETQQIGIVPRRFAYEEVQGYVKEGNYLYIVCCGSISRQEETIFNIYRYELQKEEWEQNYSRQISNLYLPSTTWKSTNVSIANGNLFYKIPYIGTNGICENGKGELWYRIEPTVWEEELFEDMEPIQVGNEYFILYGADKEQNVYQTDDCVFQKEKDVDESFIKIDIAIPQFNDNVRAYEEINRHLRDDAERFYEELLESVEHDKDVMQEQWKILSGHWCYLYAYADEHYVSVLYWDCVAYEQNGINNIEHDRYVTRLYSAETGEELEIGDLFTVSEDELMIRFAYTIRKTFSGMNLLQDDCSMLNRGYLQRYYLLTDTGIDVILAEHIRTKESHYKISYEELADILVRDYYRR